MPNPNALRGEVWIIDMGYAAKIRPALIFSIPIQPHERTLVTVVPCTTSNASTRFEVEIQTSYLSADTVFDVQQIATYPRVKLIKRVGVLTADQLAKVETAARFWLGLP